MTDDFSTLEKMAEEIMLAARDEWMKEHSDLKAMVYGVLDSQVSRAVKIILGFEFDKYRYINDSVPQPLEVDHCNGRSGNSFIGPQITEEAKRIVAEVINEVMASFEVTEDMVQAVKAEIESVMKRELKEVAYKAGKELASSVVNDIKQEILRKP